VFASDSLVRASTKPILATLLDKAFASGASPYDVANYYYSSDMGGGVLDFGKPDMDVSSLRDYVNSLGKK
jgi:hypothetical protein